MKRQAANTRTRLVLKKLKKTKTPRLTSKQFREYSRYKIVWKDVGRSDKLITTTGTIVRMKTIVLNWIFIKDDKLKATIIIPVNKIVSHEHL